jgi:hypothetical protein
MMGFAEPVIGPATSGRTRWLYSSYALLRSFPRTRESKVGPRGTSGNLPAAVQFGRRRAAAQRFAQHRKP